ncbi:hypothetical protein EYZ11_001703 [Aspergillus tanneri]|nr:hypothetical protein EYZ11_001703 [Aspergillus tanneri]
MAVWQCNPIHAAWDYDIKDAHCLNIPNIAYANAAVNIATEIMIFILPLPVLRTLHTPRKKKMALCSIFGIGVIVIAIATARLGTLSNVGTYNDFTYAQVPVYVLSCAEVAMADICAAAPTFYEVVVQIRRNALQMTEPDSIAMQQRLPKKSSPSGTPHARGHINDRIYPGSMNLSDLAIMGRTWISDNQDIEHTPSFSSHRDVLASINARQVSPKSTWSQEEVT